MDSLHTKIALVYQQSLHLGVDDQLVWTSGFSENHELLNFSTLAELQAEQHTFRIASAEVRKSMPLEIWLAISDMVVIFNERRTCKCTYDR